MVRRSFTAQGKGESQEATTAQKAGADSVRGGVAASVRRPTAPSRARNSRDDRWVLGGSSLGAADPSMADQLARGSDGGGGDAHGSGGGRSRLILWQDRLRAQFEQLSAERATLGWPVFALEHGLSAGEREELASDVRAVVTSGPPLPEVTLPWIVYAAEIGYGYEGEKYWPIFADHTPGWQDQWRDHIRWRFEEFATTYHGARPEGAWAEWFRIIAWPITHGILPRDLQRQLAELLYEARTTFRAETLASPESLGLHLRTVGDLFSARFRKFSENTTLLGQIALALLLQETDFPDDTSGSATEPNANDARVLPRTRVYPATLARIITDLSRERDARDWLTEARSVARFRMRGLMRMPFRSTGMVLGRDTASSADPGHDSGAGVDEGLGQTLIGRPRFVLRQVARDHWQVRLQFPNLSPLLQPMPRVRDALTRKQGRVLPPRGPLLARERIITEHWPDVALSEWPSAGAVLLAFDDAPPELRAILDTTFRAPPGPTWLFVIGSDGPARQQTTRVLRPGASYLLLRSTPTNNPAAGLTSVRMACTGVFGLRIDVPYVASEALIAVLGVLNLAVSHTLDVWPAGLPVGEWTGDGHAEYLVGETITLGMRANRSIAAVSVAVDDSIPVDISLPAHGGVGQAAFVAVPPLPEGRHRLVLAARSPALSSLAASGRGGGTTGNTDITLQGKLEILVRPPRTAASDATGVLSLLTQPRAPTLEDIWDGRFEIFAAALGATTLRCRVSLLPKGDTRPLLQRQLDGLAVPLDTAAWRHAFDRHVREAAATQYDEAHACLLEFDAGPLGRARLLAERDFTPLRWAVRDNGRLASLIDSRGSAGLESVSYSCDEPATPETLHPRAAETGVAVHDAGALLWARSGEAVSAVVVVPGGQRMHSLAGLTRQSRVAPCAREAESLMRLVRLASTWECARLTANPLAESRRRDALNAIMSRVVEAVAGQHWAAADALARSLVENIVDANPDSVRDAARAVETLRRLVTSRPEERALAAAIVLKTPESALQSAAERESTFVRGVRAFIHAPGIEAVARFAIRLATSPSVAIAWATSVENKPVIPPSRDGRSAAAPVGDARTLDRTIDGLLDAPVVLRAARFFALSLAAVRGVPWRWS